MTYTPDPIVTTATGGAPEDSLVSAFERVNANFVNIAEALSGGNGYASVGDIDGGSPTAVFTGDYDGGNP